MARRIALNLGQRTSLADRGRGRSRGKGSDSRGKLNIAQRENKQITNNNLGKEELNNVKKEENINKKQEHENKIRKKTELNSIDKFEQNIEIRVIDDIVPKSNMNLSNIINNKKRTRDEPEQEKIVNLDLDIIKIMGFDNFQSTKYKHVKGTDCYGINFKQKTEYRQYMNRDGGFNRALSPTRGDRKRIKISLKK